ncbi:MAG: KTSC domain-containing protein [Reyranella sp.]|nr:KTSC domain-containing protein [Reyranella sp.]
MPSTAIRSFSYDPTRRELSIIFPSLRRYTYIDVPAETYAGLRVAPSQGVFFNRHIRDHFAFRRDDDLSPRQQLPAGTPRRRRDRTLPRRSRHSRRDGPG